MASSIFDLNQKVALVTGASSGLGAHFAKVLAEAGARVVVGARREEKLPALVDDIKADGGDAMAVALDVTQAESIDAAIKQAELHYGIVDILINSAGVADSKRFVNVEESSFDFVMDTNLKGSWRMAQAVVQRLLSNKKPGSIINIASILGLGVTLGESTYAISKAAVIQMTKAMAMELVSKNIRANAICPGYFKTEINGDFFEAKPLLTKRQLNAWGN